LVEVRDRVVLVAPQCALHAERTADEVLETQPVLGEAVVGQAADEQEGRVGQGGLESPVQVDAAVVARQRDDATRVQRTALGAFWNRLELLGAAVP
jgi:hypothetical protein